jgi:hypothetical protein
MKRIVGFSVALLVCAWLWGCTKPNRGGPRLPTFPVTGTVTVNGEPAQFVTVACHPEKGAEIKSSVTCSTDAEGKFSFGTYEAGDGLPAGNYVLTFTWLVPGGLAPKDKLNGSYADPKKSQHKVTVDSKPSDLGSVALTSKTAG